MATTDTILLDTMNYLQKINRGVQGVKYAPQVSKYPTVIDTANLPLVLTWPGPAEFWLKGGGWREERRTYRVLCYILPLTQNDIPTRTLEGAALLQRFINAYTDVNNVAQANPPPYQLTIESAPTGTHHTDNGLDAQPTFGGKPYAGFELGIVVRALWQ